MCSRADWVLQMNDSEERRQRIIRYFAFGLVALVALGCSWYIIMDPKPEPARRYASEPRLPLDGIDPKEIWVDQIRTENEAIHGEVGIVMQRFKEGEEKEEEVKTRLSALNDELEGLKRELVRVQAKDVEKNVLREELRQISNSHYQPSDFFSAPVLPVIEEMVPPLSTISCQESSSLKHVDRTIPSGTTVKAILLSSVDMPCSVNGGTDPLPVKLRIVADGRLPHQVYARLKSGIVTASVYGDLSSERIYFRLEKLTQVRADGHFIETQVAGYISGEDGKYGLRGTVVDRSACLVENALISGFLSGASNFFEAAATSRLYPGCFPDSNCPPSWKGAAGQLCVAGGSGGVNNALDALTDYFIKRAEQLRPVIQVSPGRIVDITFSDSADLGDLYTHERVRSGGRREGV